MCICTRAGTVMPFPRLQLVFYLSFSVIIMADTVPSFLKFLDMSQVWHGQRTPKSTAINSYSKITGDTEWWRRFQPFGEGLWISVVYVLLGRCCGRHAMLEWGTSELSRMGWLVKVQRSNECILGGVGGWGQVRGELQSLVTCAKWYAATCTLSLVNTNRILRCQNALDI